jgi:hypothetical protein
MFQPTNARGREEKETRLVCVASRVDSNNRLTGTSMDSFVSVPA